jgi:hypothetical protein
MIPSHDIEVTTGHTEAAPLDLTTAMPPGGPVLTPSEYASTGDSPSSRQAAASPTTVHSPGSNDHTQYALADGTRGASLGADQLRHRRGEGRTPRPQQPRSRVRHEHRRPGPPDVVHDLGQACRGCCRGNAGGRAHGDRCGHVVLRGVRGPDRQAHVAAATDATDYATTAQGVKADTAVQPADLTAYATTAGL